MFGSVVLCSIICVVAKVVLVIIDHGMPYDMLAAPSPDLSADLDQRDVGGIGVPMLRALVDHASYRREETRNILSLMIHAAPRLGARAGVR